MTTPPISGPVFAPGADACADRVGRGERLAYLVAFAVLLCARLPDVLLYARFWAEEGAVFFERAWTMPWYDALLAPFGGYLNIVANGGALLARYLVPLEMAPYVTTTIGLLFQLTPAIVLLTARDSWLQRRVVLVFALAIIAMPLASEELWLQTLHSQFYLTLCAALILALDPATGVVRFLRRALLLLAGLSGLVPAALVPLFVLRAILDRSYGRAIDAGVLGFAVAAQLLVFYSVDPSRSYAISPDLFLAIAFVRHIALSILGVEISEQIATYVRAQVSQGHTPLWAPAISIAVFSLLALALFIRRCPALICLFASGCAVFAVSCFGALSDLPGLIHILVHQRYFFVSQVVFGLVVLGIAATGRDLISKVAWVFVVWFVAISSLGYFSTWDFIAHGPDWRSEVAAWRKDPSRPLKIWPTDWVMKLPPEAAR
ncbi:MAG TPA: hypothetical protein VFD26_08020 [Methyloceanibacter sp.]|nr:hypothetical protein [Methyloceanibacter sp.]